VARKVYTEQPVMTMPADALRVRGKGSFSLEARFMRFIVTAALMALLPSSSNQQPGQAPDAHGLRVRLRK